MSDSSIRSLLDQAQRYLEPGNRQDGSALNDLGNRLLDLGQIDQALACYDKAIQLQPSNAFAHFNRGFALLLAGRLVEGFQEFEWRWQCPNFPSPLRKCPQPLWDGANGVGKTLLLHAEQGLGDAIQFIRYLPMVMSKVGRVILECRSESVTLFQGMPGLAQVIASDAVTPPFDVHLPLLSLPHIFGTSMQTIPAAVPYLTPDAQKVTQWKDRLASDTSPLKVGINWQGNPGYKWNSRRSASLATFASLARVPGVSFYSLQIGESAAEVLNPPPNMMLLDFTQHIQDLSDTAALMANLDLIVSTDTSVVHLAGALGRPVWTVLCSVPDWRWLLTGDRSPWYPTMRLFRQKQQGDWDGVMSEVMRELFKVLEAAPGGADAITAARSGGIAWHHQRTLALAGQLCQTQDFGQAELLYRQVLQSNSRHAGALHGLGTLAWQAGQPHDALNLVGQAIAANPMDPAYHSTLGNVLRDLGRVEESKAAFGRAAAMSGRA